MISLQFLIGFMILAAIAAVELKDTISSVIAVGTVGLGLSLCFLLLRAPDLAVILLIVEMLTLTVLAFVAAKSKASAFFPREWPSLLMGLAFVIVFLVVALRAVAELPAFGEPLMRLADAYASLSLAKTRAANIVSAIAFDFRAYDAVAGIAVFFLVAMGVGHVAGKKDGGDEQ